MYDFSPFLKENTTFYQNKHQLLTLFKEAILVYTENHKEPIKKKQSYWLLKRLVHIVTIRL
jgi:hypothetical protein